MASDERKIVIEIKNGKDEKVQHQKSPAKRVLTTKEQLKNDTLQITKALGYYALGNAKNLLMNGIELSLNRYYKMSENYLFENEVNNVKTGIGKAISLATAVYAGAKIGTIANPGVGSLIGGTIGAVTYAFSETMSYQSKLSGYYTALNATKLQTEWGARRAGLYDDGRGTDN